LWDEAGLCDVRAGSLAVSAHYTDYDDLWLPLTVGVGPAGAFCKSLDETRRAALREALHARLGFPDGPFELHARAWAVAGTVGEKIASDVQS
jgi:hypothetical protein